MTTELTLTTVIIVAPLKMLRKSSRLGFCPTTPRPGWRRRARRCRRTYSSAADPTNTSALPTRPNKGVRKVSAIES